MADKTGIEWTDATWNPIAGCTIVSKGCTNCYAMRVAARMAAMGQAKYAGLTKTVNGNPVWTGKIAVAGKSFHQPLRWTKPRRIFVNSMSDLFHEAVPETTIDAVFAIMAMTPQHTYQVLTKRPDRMKAYLSDSRRLTRVAVAACLINEGQRPDLTSSQISAMTMAKEPKWPLLNAWLGVSVENQATADERIPLLLDTPAHVRWISAEPLLGSIDLTAIKQTVSPGYFGDCLTWYHQPHCDRYAVRYPRLNWVVVGGESGPGARPMHPKWASQLRDQCLAADTGFFFKQWGDWAPRDEWDPRATHKMVAIDRNGREIDHDTAPQDVGGQRFARVGKHAAGATLYGLEFREWPR